MCYALFFVQIFSSEDKNLQGNKTQDFIVTAIGKGDISSLLVSEKELLFSTLLQRMIEFAQGGGR